LVSRQAASCSEVAGAPRLSAIWISAWSATEKRLFRFT
jgi:hypothetical protein